MINEDLLKYLQRYLSPKRIALYEKVLSQRTNYFTVATQDIFQLHNTSAVIRSCDVFGIQNIHVIEENKPKKLDREIAMGAQKWIDVNRYGSTLQCISTLRKKGYQIVATTPYEESVLLSAFDISKPSAFFFGTEKEGLSEEVIQQADCALKIPMFGFTQSLNISVSAAIILQQLTSRLRESEFEWQLSIEEKLEVKMNWTRRNITNVELLIEKYYSS